MSYLILLMTGTLILSLALHLRHQFRQTAHIRQSLQHARKENRLSGMHDLRIRK